MIDDNLNPVWDETIFVCSANPALKFEIYDYDRYVHTLIFMFLFVTFLNSPFLSPLLPSPLSFLSLSSDDYLGTAIIEKRGTWAGEDEVQHKIALTQDRKCKWKPQGEIFVTVQSTH